MTGIDYAVFLGFMAWMVVIGLFFTRWIKNSSEMFAAGGRSPWWIAGLSGYMTVFSAGTFVVWGGVAYRLGLVAVSILMVTGFSSIFVGLLVAGRWRRMGIATPTEFLRIRFNESVVQTYTWVGMVVRSLGLGVALYSLAKMLCVLVPLSEGTPLRDPATGNFSVNWAIILWGVVIIIYTTAGGLWAVLVTEVIQCLVLCLVVLVAVPLSIGAVGGIGRLWSDAPAGFFSPASAEYSYYFLFLWFVLGFFRYAADWGFVQRFICVPTPKDARKVAFLIGGLYLISPILWMLPAMAYRVLEPGADHEEAYMHICSKVLPAGMLGIMVAAMFSATASTVSSILNVFAGVFTYDVYRALINPGASPRRMVFVGRLATILYGGLVIVIALLVPYFGAENLVIILATTLLGPLTLPAVWGLYSRRIGPRAVWATLMVCAPVVLVVEWGPGLCAKLNLSELPDWLTASIDWVKNHPKVTDALLGLVPPAVVLGAAEVISRARRQGVDAGWERMQAAFARYADAGPTKIASRLPARILAASFGMLGLLMLGITIRAETQQGTLAAFCAMLLAAAVAMTWFGFRPSPQPE